MRLAEELKQRYKRLRWVLGKYGIWPRTHITKEDLRGGEVTLTYSAFLVPRRIERYDLGPNVGDRELTRALFPLKPTTPEGRHLLRDMSEVYRTLGVDWSEPSTLHVWKDSMCSSA